MTIQQLETVCVCVCVCVEEKSLFQRSHVYMLEPRPTTTRECYYV